MLSNTRSFTVAFGDCDPSGIVFNPNYFVWFDQSVHALLARGGLSLKMLVEEMGLDGIPVVEYRTKFTAPARWDDRLTIESKVVKLHRTAFEIEHKVMNGGTLAAECAETRVCTARDAASARVKAHALPEPLRKAFEGA